MSQSPFTTTGAITRPAEEAYASAEITVPTVSQAVSQEVGRKFRLRRQAGSSDEEESMKRTALDHFRDTQSELNNSAAKEMLLEIKGYEFRIGGPILCRLPATWFGLTPENSVAKKIWDDGLSTEIERILEQNSASYVNFQLRRQLWRHSNQAPSEFNDTILIIARNHDERLLWYQTAFAIRHMCSARGFSNLNVEIAVERGYKGKWSYTIEDDLPVVQRWPFIEPQVKLILGKTRWVAIDLVRRGYERIPTHNPPTICITYEESAMCQDFPAKRDAIVDLLTRYRLGDVAVDIGRGSLLSAPGDESSDQPSQPDLDENARHMIPDDSYRTEAMVGRSLGPSGRTRQNGTFGGVLELRFEDGTSKNFGCTCNHVAVPLDHDNADHARWAREGIKPGDSANNLKVDQPTKSDLVETRRAKVFDIHQLDDAKHASTARTLQDPNDFVIPSDQKRYDLRKEQITKQQEMIKKMKMFDTKAARRLGSVYAASGYRRDDVAGGRSVTCDWALLVMDPTRQTRNHLLQRSQITENAATLGRYDPKSSVMTGVQPVEEDLDMYKVGRTTGFTRSHYNGRIKSTISSWVRSADNQLSFVTGHDSSVSSNYRSVDFGAGGDSGSFIMDQTGAFVGLYWAGNTYSNMGYFMEARDLFEDIRRITGAVEVKLPQ